jgi:uncharacterized membrane protein YphA (DoxX/SURF4 family)
MYNNGKLFVLNSTLSADLTGSTDLMWTAGVLAGQCFSILLGLFELTACSLIVLFVRQGVLLRELTWGWFLLHKRGGNT